MDPEHTTASELTASSAKTTMTGGQQEIKVSSRIGYFRWIICALLLIGTTKN